MSKYRSVLLCGAACLAVLSGCVTQKELVQEQRNALAELADENSRLESTLSVLRDSLQFVDDIETGQYYRDRRALEQRIDRLEYEMAVCRDSSEVPLEELAVFSVDDLFAPASADLTDAGVGRLEEVVSELRDNGARMIRVEGHSDPVPLGASLRDRYPSNWELSAARASAVARALIDTYGFSPGRIEVAAFGDSQPIATNDTAEGRRRNRRVRIATY